MEFWSICHYNQAMSLRFRENKRTWLRPKHLWVSGASIIWSLIAGIQDSDQLAKMTKRNITIRWADTIWVTFNIHFFLVPFLGTFYRRYLAPQGANGKHVAGAYFAGRLLSQNSAGKTVPSPSLKLCTNWIQVESHFFCFLRQSNWPFLMKLGMNVVLWAALCYTAKMPMHGREGMSVGS